MFTAPDIANSTVEERRAFIKAKFPCIADCDMCGLCKVFHGKDAETAYSDYIEGTRSFLEVSDDYKSALQELIQHDPSNILSYELIEEKGPDHSKTFTFAALLNGEVVGTGSGSTKKSAEQAAARNALEKLNDERP